MDTTEKLAAALAEDTLKVMDSTGEDRFYVEVGNMLAASSQSLEEAYLTEIRVRLAERQARRFIEGKLKEARSKAQATAKDPA
jgi:hypothetical protein